MVATTAETTGQGQFGRATYLFPFLFGMGAILVVYALAFLPSWQWIFGEWSSSAGALSHGYLVAAMSVYLFIREIPRAASIPVAPMWWALPVLLTLSVLWLLGVVATVVAVQTVVLPAILITAIAFAFGLPIARRFAFPVLFIYFAIPAVEHLQFIFQALTVAAVSLLIRLADIPALVEGNLVFIPQGTFEIAGGCAGLSFVVAGLSLAVFYAHLYYTRLAQSFRLLAVVLAVAMIGNWIRVFTIIIIGYRSGMQSPLVQDHLTLGWIMFAILMVPVYFLARRLEGPDAVAVEPSLRGLGKESPNWGAVMAAIVIMLVGPVWANTVSSPSASDETIELNLPAGHADWTGPHTSHWDWRPEYARPAAEAVAEYQSGAEVVLVYANVYLSQEQNRELIYFNNDIKGGWSSLRDDRGLSDTVYLQDGSSFGQTSARNYIGDWLIWYRYQNGDVFDTSAGRAKFSQAIETLKGRPNAGIVAFATPCRDQCNTASERLAAFIRQVGFSINLDSVQEQQ